MPGVGGPLGLVIGGVYYEVTIFLDFGVVGGGTFLPGVGRPGGYFRLERNVGVEY